MDALLDYTIFHIGVYLTLSTAIVAADVFWNRNSMLMPISVILLLVAGAAGGVVAGNIPANSTVHYSDFIEQNATILYDWRTPFTYWWVIAIEHTSFWIAILLLLAKFLRWRLRQNQKKSKQNTQMQLVATSFSQIFDSFDAHLEEKIDLGMQKHQGATQQLSNTLDQIAERVESLERRSDE